MSASANRNKPCPCGSGKKWKRCCWHKAQFPERKRLQAEHDAVHSRMDAREKARREDDARAALMVAVMLGGRIRA